MRPDLRRRYESSDAGRPLSALPSNSVAFKPIMSHGVSLIIAIYVVLALIHSLLVPTGQTGYQNAPDEAAHVSFVRSISRGSYPTLIDDTMDPKHQSYEWHQPPAYYIVASPMMRFGVHGLRLVSILFGAISLWLVYRISILIFPEAPDLALFATAISALTPGHTAITSTVNNDGLIEVCFSCALLALINLLRSGITVRKSVYLGAAIGFALLTKATAIILIPISLITFIVLWRSGESLAELSKGIAVVTLTTVVLSGWWYVRNALTFHELLPVHAFQASFRGTAQAMDIIDGRIAIPMITTGWTGYWLLVMRMSFQSFWAVYGTTRLARNGAPAFLPDQVYIMIAVVVIVCAIGLVRLHFQRKDLLTETQIHCVSILFTSIVLVTAAFALFLSQYFQTQGRYLYPVMAPICIVLALGWRNQLPERYRYLSYAVVILFFGAVTAIYLSAVQAAA